jgi:hypothetical protein
MMIRVIITLRTGGFALYCTVLVEWQLEGKKVAQPHHFTITFGVTRTTNHIVPAISSFSVWAMWCSKIDMFMEKTKGNFFLRLPFLLTRYTQLLEGTIGSKVLILYRKVKNDIYLF